MVTSLLNNMPVEVCHNDRLFFDRYHYSMSFHCPNMSSIRGFSKIVDQDNRHNFIKKLHQTRLHYRRQFGRTTPQPLEPDENIDYLLEISDLLYSVADCTKLTVTRDWGYIYSNDIDILRKIDALSFVSRTKLKQCVVNRPRNSILLNSPEYNKRTYFIETWLNLESTQRLGNLLKNQQEIKIGPSLRDGLKHHNSRGFYLRRYHFFDHSSDSIPLMVNLVAPGLIRQTVEVLTK